MGVKTRNPPVCPYCKATARFADSAEVYGRSYGMVWLCANYPKCDSYVGVHKGTRIPLGVMANKDLRYAKTIAHSWFDPLWMAKRLRDKCGKAKARSAGYKWLAGKLGIPASKCHIGMFDVELCMKTAAICEPFHR